ncbi:MAG: CoA transferase [Pseudomonadota bacterium]
MKKESQQAGGVRVVEYAGSGIAAAYAGWLLARLGAHVTRLESPLAGASRRDSPVQLALEVLADGKSTASCPATAAEFDALLADCDILLCDTPQALEALAGPVQSLEARLPWLVIGIATTFGMEGPYAGLAGTSLDAQALSAVAWSLGEPGRAPLSLPPGIVEHQSGALLASGCLLALAVRDERGSGRVVDIALADVLASYVAGNCRVYIHHGLQWQRSGRRASGSCGAYPYMLLPCKDGEVCVCGRTRDEWNRLVAVMGSPDWAAQPRYQDLRAMGTKYPDEVDQLVMPWFAQHTKAELEAVALKNNLIVSPIRNFDEVLQTQHFTQSGFFVEGRAAGKRVTVPALPFRVLESRSDSAPNIASGLLRAAPPLPGKKPLGSASKPLAGLRVLDFGWVWSAPWVGTILGELGAQVIKVEHALRPDNLRLAGRVIRDGKVVEGPSKEMSPMYHQINHGKLGITLNAKEPRAVELLKQLVAMSDIVVENMSPGSMERSHLGYDELRAVNPRIVMLAMSAAGQFGALSNMRAYAPTMSSFIGMEALVGYPGEAPIGALNFGLGDPNASAHALVAVFAALRRARSTGEGSYIDLSQIESLLGTLRPYLIESQVQGRQTPTMGNRHPDMAPHGIYPAAGDDAWLTLAVADDAQWQSLKRLTAGASWAQDTRFRTLDGRLAHGAELDAAIAGWSVIQPRDALVARLREAGIASSPVLSVEEQWQDPHFAAREIKQIVDIPVYGKEDMFKAPWRFSDFAPEITRCGPSLGQHNDHVFTELLGLSPQEIADLKQSGVIA